MKALRIAPVIYKIESLKSFTDEFIVGEGDLIFTNIFVYKGFIEKLNLKCEFLFWEDYGTGEPDSDIVDAILAVISKKRYKRIIAIGGGTVIDVAKLLALKDVKDSTALFEHKLPIIRDKELIIIPTTCGTGSEVTNISIVAFPKKNTKLGLAEDELYADSAILIPELLKALPYKFFLFSSVDALVHAVESFLSPKASSFTKLFSVEAINIIVDGYKSISKNGEEKRMELLSSFLDASCFAGIAFSNAGCGLVHAMSYPLSCEFHVAHGEANYQFFMGVLRFYMDRKQDGSMKELCSVLANALGCDESSALVELELLLSSIIEKFNLSHYGMVSAQTASFSEDVIKSQQRLLQNSFIPVTQDDIEKIYKSLI